MSIKASIYHLTHYRYDRPVVLGPQVIRLRPAPHSRTRVLSHSLKVTPADHFVNHQQDPYGNWLSRFVFPEPVTELKIEVDLVADMTVYNPFDFFVEDERRALALRLPRGPPRRPRRSTCSAEPVGPRLAGLSRHRPARAHPHRRLRRRPQRAGSRGEIGYVIRMEPGVQTPEETFERGTGSCRDTSWLLVQTLRNLGLAARFVSGYLIQLKPDLVALDGPPGTDHDFTDLHAWAEVYLPGAGWIGLDPTSRPADRREPHPARRDPALPQRRADLRASRASPTSTSPSTCRSPASPSTRASPSPSPTRPGRRSTPSAARSTTALAAGDVRLTMGGEPTFVSIDDFESDGVEHRRRRPDEARRSPTG